MKTPTNKTQGDRRTAERRATAERRSEPMRAAAGDRRAMQGRGVAEAMTDALEDILAWERASERMIKVADPSTADLASASASSSR